MVDYAYTTVPGKIKGLLGKIRTTGVPAKLTAAHLKTLGFRSSNDGTLIGVMKFIGLIDASGIPTPMWSEYRGAQHKAVLAKGIRNGYADLFAVYPDANLRPNSELAHVFSTSSSAGAQVIDKTVKTFKAVVDEADFSAANAPTETTLPAGPLHTPAAPTATPAVTASNSPSRPSNGPEVHIDIQIHISPDSSHEQIDKIFESMARHLYGPKNS
jgi:uncharacterized protein DUF5343